MAGMSADEIRETWKEGIEAFGIRTEIYEDKWTVSYKIGFSFIKKYYPQFDIEKCKFIC